MEKSKPRCENKFQQGNRISEVKSNWNYSVNEKSQKCTLKARWKASSI